ncbi:unnamed protein product, partial [Prorocentrum cordatum]
GGAPYRTAAEALLGYLDTRQTVALRAWACSTPECVARGVAADDPAKMPNVLHWPRVLILHLLRWDNKPIRSARSGHYVAFASRGDRWHVCDDKAVRPATESEGATFVRDRVKGHTYLLFYEKVDSPAVSVAVGLVLDGGVKLLVPKQSIFMAMQGSECFDTFMHDAADRVVAVMNRQLESADDHRRVIVSVVDRALKQRDDYIKWLIGQIQSKGATIEAQKATIGSQTATTASQVATIANIREGQAAYFWSCSDRSPKPCRCSRTANALAKRMCVKTFDQRGEWVNVSETLAVKGFKAGVTVYNSQEGDESVHEIKAIDGQNVKMQTGDVERTIDAEDFMRNKFAIYDIKKEVIDQFDKFSPLNCMDYHWGTEEARIKIALDEVDSQHSACLKHITAIHSPIEYTAVSVKKEFKKDAIGLVPLTTTISLKKATDEINIGNACLRKYTDPAKHTDYNVALMAAGGLKLKREEGGTGIGGLKRVPDQYGVPFWLVGACTAKEKPNLAVTFVTATSGIKVPILKNTVELKSGDRLRMSEDTAKALARKVALSDATPAKPAKEKAKTQRAAHSPHCRGITQGVASRQSAISSQRTIAVLAQSLGYHVAHAAPHVYMSAYVSMRAVIEGGGLKEPWMPRTIVHSGGIAFIEVSLVDRRLFQFVDIQNPTNRNAPFAQNHFFKELKALRNAASDIAIWEYMKSRDPLLSDQSDQDKLIKAYKKNIDESAMPAYVTVQLPEVEFNGGGVALKCEPIAEAASDMPNFGGYWQKQLHKLQDMCRQYVTDEKYLAGNAHLRLNDARDPLPESYSRGLPNLYFTMAPAEWKALLHEGLLGWGQRADNLSEGQAALTLHLHHILGTLIRDVILRKGAPTDEEGNFRDAYFEKRHACGIDEVFDYCLRFEFQSRGTLHVHVLAWVKYSKTNMDEMSGRSNQEGPKSDLLKWFEELSRSSVDVQCGDGHNTVLQYVAGYVSKASDALTFKYGDYTERDSPWRMTYRLLCKRASLLPEMALEFSDCNPIDNSYRHDFVYAPLPRHREDDEGPRTTEPEPRRGESSKRRAAKNSSTKLYEAYLKRPDPTPFDEWRQ